MVYDELIDVVLYEDNATFIVDLDGDNELAVDLQSSDFNFSITIDNLIVISGGDVDVYEGEYTVVPRVVSQTLDTDNKLMKDDVTVKKIPYYETANPSGGTTIYIGDEV